MPIEVVAFDTPHPNENNKIAVPRKIAMARDEHCVLPESPAASAVPLMSSSLCLGAWELGLRIRMIVEHLRLSQELKYWATCDVPHFDATYTIPHVNLLFTDFEIIAKIFFQQSRRRGGDAGAGAAGAGAIQSWLTCGLVLESSSSPVHYRIRKVVLPGTNQSARGLGGR